MRADGLKKSLTALVLLALACGSGTDILQYKPVIERIRLSRTIVCLGEFIDVEAVISDQNENDELTFKWRATNGFFVSDTNNPSQWHAPADSAGVCTLILEVSDGTFVVVDSTRVEVRTCP